MELIEIMKQIETKEGAIITKHAEIENDNFKSYQYFIFEYNNNYYYMQSDKYSYPTITAYRKIDYNHKQQKAYQREVRSIEDIEKYIEDSEKYRGLKGLPIQIIHYDFNAINEFDGIHRTTYIDYLRFFSGYREKEVIKQAKHIRQITNNRFYEVVEIISDNGESIEIDLKSYRITG